MKLNAQVIARALAHQFRFLTGKSVTAPKEYAILLANIAKVYAAGSELVIEMHDRGTFRVNIQYEPASTYSPYTEIGLGNLDDA